MNNTTKRWIFDSVVWSVSLLFVFGLLINEAMAESGAPVAANVTWKAECGSCHLAYSPELLPASSWRKIMASLDRHFGTDASMDAASAAQIGAFLEHNAGRDRGRGGDANSLRITETRWFQHKHDEVPASAWKNPKVKTAANCSACHGGAERSNFDEHAVRIPR